MMWSQAILLLLVGAVFATPTLEGWKNGKEYTYKVRSRTMTSFNQQSKQYSGIVMEASLTVQPKGQDTLRAQVSKARYAQVHTRLDNGWDSEIPRNQMNSQSLPLSSQPFEVKINKNVVRDLIVNKNVPTWEVNILKAIVSQLQVDARGQNAENSKENQLPEGRQPFAVFKTMEDSVSGRSEVIYDVSPLSDQVLQSQPELVPIPELRGEDGEHISIVKTRNYSNTEHRVSYHFGISGKNSLKPGSNDNGKFLSRSSISRVIISGELRKYHIQSSVTVNKVVHGADSNGHQHGMVASKMNLTLSQVKDAKEQIPAPSEPESTGSLVYNYNNPLDKTARRPNKPSNEENRKRSQNKRSRGQQNSDEYSSISDDTSNSLYSNEEDNYMQPRPKLTEAPQTPLLPYYIGNGGNSIQKDNKVDVVKAAKSIAQQIGSELQKPDNMVEEQTLEKFTILTRLVRTMNAEQIAEVKRDLIESKQSSNQLNQNNQNQRERRNAWEALRDAIAQAGTGPALVNVKQMIQNKNVDDQEAAAVIDTVAQSARTPTPQYMDAFFEMVKQLESQKESAAHESAVLSLADLIRHAIVNKRSAHNRFPVHVFGRLFNRENNNLQEKYIPYLSEKLKKAVEEGDSKKVQLYTTAIGRTGDSSMLSVFEPYLEGRKQVSPFQRFVMVISLNKLAENKPKLARSVLYKIYANTADHHEIRTAAVYLLMKTNPPASMLQRMAEFTNLDSNKQVNSAVKSIISSLAELEDDGENRDLARAARSAKPLLTSEKFGPQYSRAVVKKYKNPLTQSSVSIEANYVGSGDSIIPKGVYVSVTPSVMGMKDTSTQFGAAVSSVQDLMDLVRQQMSNDKNQSKNSQSQEEKFSPEKIARLLGIQGKQPSQVEGFAFLRGTSANRVQVFDNHTLEKLPKELRRLVEEIKQGRDYESTKLLNHEITISFPTETGLPLFSSYKAPIVMSIRADAKVKSNSGSQESSSKSLAASGKARIVVGMKVQERLGFVVPFENQEYVTGLDKNVQVHLPIQSEVEWDNSQKEVRVKVQVQPLEGSDEVKVLQFKTQPFTAKHDITNLEPLSKDQNTHILHKNKATKLSVELNDQNKGKRVEFTFERLMNEDNNQNAEKKMQNALESAQKMARSIASMVSPQPEETEFEKYSLKVTPRSDMSLEVRVSMDSLITENNNSQESSDSSLKAKAPRLEKDLGKRERKQKLLKEAAKNINSAEANAIDISVQYSEKVAMSLTAAIARSNVDEKSRVLVHAAANVKNGRDAEVSAALEMKAPNTLSLDYEETLKANPKREFDAEIRYGQRSAEGEESNSKKIKIQGKAKQTESRKTEVRQSRDAQECSKEESRNGNKMSAACERANQRAATIDAGEMTITFENESAVKTMLLSAIDAVEPFAQQLAQVSKNRQEKEEKNRIRVSMQRYGEKEVDITVKTPEAKYQSKVSLDSKKRNNENERENNGKEDSENRMSTSSMCFMDKTQIKSFDDRRFSSQLGKCWHVAMTTFPKNDADNGSQKREIPEDERVSILVRENDEGKKEMKITLGDKELELKPASESESNSNRVEAKVNGERVQFSQGRSHQQRRNDKVQWELLRLHDGSAKLISNKFDVYVIYDGSRAKIRVGNKYRDSVRGLCGNNDGEPVNDQQTPQGYLLQNPQEFAATWALTNEEQCQGPARENAEKAKNAPRAYLSARPGNVISDREAGRKNEEDSKERNNDESDRKHMKHRTLVQRKGDKICFSKRPVPTCSSQSSPKETRAKKVDFHCVQKSEASEKVAARVEQGANPDLTQKMTDRSESIQIPISCQA